MNSQNQFDLIIVGAGPAGLSTALHLIQKDQSWKERMIVLEKAEHPRAKLCGGGITRTGLITLQKLNFPLPLPIPQWRVENIYLRYKNRTIHVRGKPQIVVIHRPGFDHLLSKEAKQRGIRILENQEVLSVIHQSNQVVLETSENQYDAKMIVGADGSASLVKKSIQGLQPSRRIARTLEAWSPERPTSEHFLKHSALFDFSNLTENLQGYLWEFPSQIEGTTGYNRGVYDARMVHTRSKANLTGILNESLMESGINPKLVEINGAPIYRFDPRHTISVKRTILVGEAAGVDSLFGEGISPALGYGKVAADEIIKAFENQDFNFKAYKQRLLRSKTGRYLIIRWLIANYLYYLGHRAGCAHTLWTAGQVLATIWRSGRLY